MTTDSRPPLQPPLRALSSKATQSVLTALLAAWQQQGGQAVQLLAIGGVDAARRVQAGEAWDVVFLSHQALSPLLAAQQLLAGSRVDLFRSAMAVAVPQGAPVPDISSVAALQQALRAAPSIAYSTGPSGVALQALLADWGLADALAPRCMQAPPGVPVGSLLAQGQAALGFQQYSELLGVEGIHIVGPMPPGAENDTIFSAAIGSSCTQAASAQALLAFMAAPAATGIITGCGMQRAAA